MTEGFRTRLVAERADIPGEVVESAATALIPIAECLDRSRVSVSGVVTSVTARSRSGWPRLEAVLSDGSASVTLTWLGRRAIRGVEQGSRLDVQGMMIRRGARRIIFNPSYDLRPRYR